MEVFGLRQRLLLPSATGLPSFALQVSSHRCPQNASKHSESRAPTTWFWSSTHLEDAAPTQLLLRQRAWLLLQETLLA